VHSYTNEYIRFADTKAAAVIAWCATMIGVLYSTKAHLRFMDSAYKPTDVVCSPDFVRYVSMIAFMLLAAAIVLAFWCLKPRLWSVRGEKVHPPRFIYWEQVLAHQDSEKGFKDAFGEQSYSSLADHCASHLQVLAGIAKVKYKWVNWSIRVGAIGTALGGIALLFSK
jgi:hypothetical protein